MNIALTGSSGQIGSKLLMGPGEMGHNVLCISSSIYHSKVINIFSYKELELGNINYKADCLLNLVS